MTLDRRSFFKTSLASMPFLGLASSLRAMAASPFVPVAHANRRLLTIFLRGGNDSLNTVVPFGDPSYQPLRPNIYYGAPGSGAPRQAIAFPGYTQLGIHPQLAPLLETVASDIGNRVAFLHRVGNLAGQRSHFTEMHMLETGMTTFVPSAEGWLPQIIPMLNLPASTIMPSVSESNRVMRMYLSGTPGQAPTHIQQAYASASLSGQRAIAIPFAADVPGARLATRVRNAVLTNTGTYPIVGSGAYLRNTAADAIDDLARLRLALPSITHDEARFPTANPKYATFFERLEESVQFLRNGISNFVGVELGGWDTHNQQLTEHAEVLQALATAVRSSYDVLRGGTDDFLIMVVSEFGRTVADNGNVSGTSPQAGTDHGVGGVCIAVGTTVRRGLYNCSHTSWAQSPGTPTGVARWTMLANTPSSGIFANALEPVTDFRVPFIELAQTFFGLTLAQIQTLPGIGNDWHGVLTNPALVPNRMLNYLL